MDKKKALLEAIAEAERELQEGSGRKAEREYDSIKMRYVHCLSCGSKLAANNVEASSFCIYCGQATVVEDTVEDYPKPDYIIPFKIKKNEAERSIREHLNKGFFVPKEIKNFEVEDIRGIYIPYRLFDMEFRASQYWKFDKRKENDRGYYEFFDAKTVFRNLTVDASDNMNDDLSFRLEPYDLSELKEFDPKYLSGYYMDLFDAGSSEIREKASKKAERIFSEAARRKLTHKGELTLEKSTPEYNVLKTERALFPVWFLTFKYMGKQYTILVNGQTGKTVGAVPYSMFYTKLLSWIFGAIGVAFFTAVSWVVFVKIGVYNPELGTLINESHIGHDMVLYYSIGIPILSLVMIFYISNANRIFDSIKKSIDLTTSKKTVNDSEERQDK